MEETLEQMRLCGLLPCLEAETLSALHAASQALRDAGFPCAEVTFTTALGEAPAWKDFFTHQPLALGARVNTGEEAAWVLSVGARWVTLPAGETPQGLQGKENVFQIAGHRDDTPKTKEKSPAVLCCEAGDIEAVLGEWPQAQLLVAGCTEGEESKGCLARPQVVAVRVPLRVQEALAQSQAMALRQQWGNLLGFSLAHVGLNAQNEGEAEETARAFSLLLGIPYVPGAASHYAGTILEVMKEPGRGTHGHIGILTDNLERGMYFARQVGFSFDPASRKNDSSGRAVLYYLDREIGGFALHLLQK